MSKLTKLAEKHRKAKLINKDKFWSLVDQRNINHVENFEKSKTKNNIKS